MSKEQSIEVYDYSHKDLTQLSREELYSEVLNSQKFAIETISKFDWIFGAFLLTLINDFRFGKKRIQKVLKGIQKRFTCYSAMPNVVDLNPQLEAFGFKIFFHGGKVLLKDLSTPPEEYFDDLSTDLRSLARKIELGDTENLSEKEQEMLKLVREIE